MSEYQSIKAPQVDVEATAEEQTNQQNQTRRYLKLAVAGNVILLLVLAASMISGATKHSLTPAGQSKVPVEGYPYDAHIDDYENCIAYDDKGAELGYASENGIVYKLSGFAKDMAAGRHPDFSHMDHYEIEEYHHDVAVGEYIDTGGGHAIFYPLPTNSGGYPEYFGVLQDQALYDDHYNGDLEERGYVVLTGGDSGEVYDLDNDKVGTVKHNTNWGYDPRAEARCAAAVYFLNEAVAHVEHEHEH